MQSLIYQREGGITVLQMERDKLTDTSNGLLYFAVDLKKFGAISTKTGSDGKFKFEINDDREKIIMAATGTRGWIVPVEPNQKTLNLTDSNQNILNCSLCKDGSN